MFWKTTNQVTLEVYNDLDKLREFLSVLVHKSQPWGLNGWQGALAVLASLDPRWSVRNEVTLRRFLVFPELKSLRVW
jgi:hypothetical protein